jgi:hypothetical protein
MSGVAPRQGGGRNWTRMPSIGLIGLDSWTAIGLAAAKLGPVKSTIRQYRHESNRRRTARPGPRNAGARLHCAVASSGSRRWRGGVSSTRSSGCWNAWLATTPTRPTWLRAGRTYAGGRGPTAGRGPSKGRCGARVAWRFQLWGQGARIKATERPVPFGGRSGAGHRWLSAC